MNNVEPSKNKGFWDRFFQYLEFRNRLKNSRKIEDNCIKGNHVSDGQWELFKKVKVENEIINQKELFLPLKTSRSYTYYIFQCKCRYCGHLMIKKITADPL